MLKEGYYKCIAGNYMVTTKMFCRIPELENYELEGGALYRVNPIGRLEVPGKGTAKITDEVEKILAPYESDDKVKHWDEIRTQASIHIIASVIGMQKTCASIDFNRAASVVVTAADAIVDELKRRKS